MHKIVQSHLNNFVKEQSIETFELSKQFELFTNFCIIYKFYSNRFDVKAVTSGNEDDCGIDGIAFIIDGELATTIDEAETIFKRNKKISQSKSSSFKPKLQKNLNEVKFSSLAMEYGTLREIFLIYLKENLY